MRVVAFVQQPERARNAAATVLDPEMHGLRFGVASVDIGVRAVLLDDEHVLTDGEDAEQRPRLQLVEVSGVDLRRVLLVQLAAYGATTDVQKEQRCAALGMTLKHSGHARVFDSTGLAVRACIRL